MESNKVKCNTGDAEEDQVIHEIKYPILTFEKQIFIDAFEKDALVILAKYDLNKCLATSTTSCTLWLFSLFFKLQRNKLQQHHFKFAVDI